MPKKGVLITFEGGDGAGKSTLMTAVADLLRKMGLPVTLTREPGGSPLAEQIRNVILKNKMTSLTELFLYEAARNEHCHRTLFPALTKGHIVLCDRFVDSSLAYQGYARGLPWKLVQQLNQAATENVKPDLTVFLDSDPKTNIRHARVKTRFEKEGVSFQKKVRLGYLRARKENSAKWITIEARSEAPLKMAHQVTHEISKRFLK